MKQESVGRKLRKALPKTNSAGNLDHIFTIYHYNISLHRQDSYTSTHGSGAIFP